MQKLYGEMETAINEKKQQRDFSSKNCSMKEDVSEVIKKSRTLKKYLSRAISFGLPRSFGLQDHLASKLRA
jgi:hypothetical protein